MAALAIPFRRAESQDAYVVPAFASGTVRVVLRAGDGLQLGRLDACERPASQVEARIEAVFPDSILLRTSAGWLLLRAGAGDALATGYQPVASPAEQSAGRPLADVATAMLLGAGGAVAGMVGGFLTALSLLLLVPLEPFMVAGSIVGGMAGLWMAADLRNADAAVTTRLSTGWGQLELRRDVRAAACEFRPAP